MTLDVAVPGYARLWVPDDAWKLLRVADHGVQCRMVSGRDHVRCPNIAVAALNRGRRGEDGQRVDSWWAYCEEHLYGRRIRNGRIEYRRLVPVAEA